MYVSITGLKPKSIWSYLLFWRHAVPSLSQAKQAEGLISVDVKKVNGYQHTLSAWESRKYMLAYLKSGAHKKAMKNFGKIGTGATIGFEAEVLPGWDEAIKYWQDNAVPYEERNG